MNADNLPSPGDINGTGRLRAICAKAISYTEILGSFGEGTSDTGTDLAKFFNACLTAANATATSPQGGSGGGGGEPVPIFIFGYLNPPASALSPCNIVWRSSTAYIMSDGSSQLVGPSVSYSTLLTPPDTGASISDTLLQVNPNKVAIMAVEDEDTGLEGYVIGAPTWS